MTTDWTAGLEELFGRWNDGKIARWQIESRLMELSCEDNVDELCRALPEWYRPTFEERLRELALVENPDELFSIVGGTFRPETDAARREREAAERRERGRMCAVARAWHTRNR